jgi:hypothetical protein
MCRLSRNLGASTSWSPKGLSRPVVGLLYLLHAVTYLRVGTGQQFNTECKLLHTSDNHLKPVTRVIDCKSDGRDSIPAELYGKCFIHRNFRNPYVVKPASWAMGIGISQSLDMKTILHQARKLQIHVALPTYSICTGPCADIGTFYYSNT